MWCLPSREHNKLNIQYMLLSGRSASESSAFGLIWEKCTVNKLIFSQQGFSLLSWIYASVYQTFLLRRNCALNTKCMWTLNHCHLILSCCLACSLISAKESSVAHSKESCFKRKESCLFDGLWRCQLSFEIHTNVMISCVSRSVQQDGSI